MSQSDSSYPHLVVAVVCERDGRYLMIEEESDGAICFNQPAGHVEIGESLIEAAVRECREESGHHFTAEAICGIYQWRNQQNGIDYLRFVLCGQASQPPKPLALDSAIIACHWLTYEEIVARRAALRSPMVLAAIDDWRGGQRYPLSLVRPLE
jgi:8-oxo-dGTP pyrophosphatase MutT (NUDIX family)